LETNIITRQPDPQSDDNLPVGNLIKELTADPEARESIASADVIVGINIRDPGHKSLFYGRATLQRIARSDKEPEITVLEVPVDFETDDVEALGAACLVALAKSNARNSERSLCWRRSTFATPIPVERLLHARSHTSPRYAGPW
jgi:hypothetical protein